MKKGTLLIAIFILSTNPAYTQTFSIDDDGIVKCEGAEPGDKATLLGDIYEAVDRDLLIQRRDDGTDLSKVCTSLVNDMTMMFYGKGLIDHNISNWDVSNVTNMGWMFYSSSTNHEIGKWDVSAVTIMKSMFYQSSFNQDISDWDVSNVIDMKAMFEGSSFNQDISDWDVSNVVDMSFMFIYSRNFNQDLNSWNVSNVKNMEYMFAVANAFNKPIGNWDVSNVTNMRSMFSGASSFNQPIGDWDVSSVTNMIEMFHQSVFNQPIDNWDVSNVVEMNLLFYNSLYNKPLNKWIVSSVTDMGSMFAYSDFNQPIDNWDVSSVTNMEGMFYGSSFHQPIGNWDVSQVTNMGGMFGSSSFNHPIGNWDVSNVTIMYGMFYSSSFNQPISKWCVTKINSEPPDFSTNAPLTPEYKPVWGTCPGTPPKAMQLHPLHSSTDVSRNVELNWNSDTLSTKYQLQVFEGFDPIVIDTLIADTTYNHIYPFKDNFAYNWRVRGYNETLNRFGEWSSLWKFTTLLDTSIDSDDQPTQFSLSQNYPNPFNPSTTIRFNLPESGMVTIEVFNSIGQKVRNALNGHLESGAHNVSFDASGLPSGIYFYTVSFGETSLTRSMLLLK